MNNYKKIKEFLLFFTIQLVLYVLLVINYRAVSRIDYNGTIFTDFTIASFNFFVVRKIAKSDDSFHQWVGYAIGGAVGGGLGLYLSRLLFGC